MVGSVKMQRDYAKRLPATFNLEIQSEHFGNGQSLSIEESTVETHETVDNNVEKMWLQFYSHFLNNSRQDATTTNAHMTVLIDALIAKNAIHKQTTPMQDDTDGRGKQYRCAKAYWLLLSFKV